MRKLRGLKLCVVALAASLVVACSAAKKDEVGIDRKHAATPGSTKDFALNVGDRIYFPVNQTSLTNESMEVLKRQGTWLKLFPKVKVTVSGHADERGTREYNLGLSARRASSTQAFLISQGISPDRISIVSFGKERPVALCDAESCWSQNRRSVTQVTEGAVPSKS